MPGAHLDNRTQAEREKPKSAVFRGGGPGEIRGLRKRGTARENKKRLIRPVARRREAPWVPEGTRKSQLVSGYGLYGMYRYVPSEYSLQNAGEQAGRGWIRSGCWDGRKEAERRRSVSYVERG